jgi:DNA polymerase III epsilon subunit family exonuclease
MSVGSPTVEIMTETRDGAVADARDVRLADLDFTVVDVETTGWAPDDAGITEIGAVRVHDGRVVAEFGSLVNPGRPVPAPITELTGIDDQMLTGAPPVAAVLPGLLAFARGSVLVAHNAPFDLRFLTAACAGMGLLWPRFEVLDTVRLARHLMATPQEVPDRKLATLAGYFGTPVRPSHRALDDARATAAVLGRLLARLAEREAINTLAELDAWLAARDAEAAAAAAERSAGVLRPIVRLLRRIARLLNRPGRRLRALRGPVQREDQTPGEAAQRPSPPRWGGAQPPRRED